MGDPDAGASVIVTVLNERDALARLLDSLAAQDPPPAEVVVADGGSTDGTLDLLRSREARGDLPLVVLERPGANISAGRNAAIDAARGPLIACTDVGVRLDADWLARLVEPTRDGARFVAGFFASDPVGAFQTALGATTLPEAGDIDPVRFLPSSRSVAFRKEDAVRAGGYPEWLDYCEDLVFDIRLRAIAGPPAWAPGAVARFRPRPNLPAFARQYYRYARGDGKAGLWPRRHAVRYVAYLVALPLILYGSLAGHPAWSLLLVAAGGAMTRRPYRRLVHQWAALDRRERVAAAVWVPVIRVVGDAAKMIGYPVGVWWRLGHRPPEWRPRGEEAQA